MQQQKRKMSFGVIAFILVAALLIIGIIGSQMDSKKSTSRQVVSESSSIKLDTSKAISDSKGEPDSVESWTYYEKEDKMTLEKVKYAAIYANDLLEFEFPYNGGSVAGLTLRKRGKSLDLFLQVTKGQFNGTFDGGQVRIRFDDNPPKKYSFSGASDASSDIIFLDSEKEIVNQIKKSKKMIIEVEFYQNGLRQIEFNVGGLKWE